MSDDEAKIHPTEIGTSEASAAPTEVRPDASAEEVNETRRALVRAGWILPAVFAVQLPIATSEAFASTLHADAHVDAGT